MSKSEPTESDGANAEDEFEPMFETEFDTARAVMYEELAEQFGENALDEELESAVVEYLTELYDNREQLAAAQERAGQPPR